MAFFTLGSYAQVVNQIYDHDSTDLTELYNMPFNENRLLVVAGYDFSPEGTIYYELPQGSNQLVEMSFANVDTVFGSPRFKEDKLFFEASVAGLGRELAAFDGTTTFTFDFNNGAGNSNPELYEFDNELYVIATNGSIRQLYKYVSGTFEQISEEVQNDVVNFIANRGNEYYYITFNSTNGRFIRVTENNGGLLTHSTITQTSFQETLGHALILNGDIYTFTYIYSTIDAFYRIDKIDLNNTITTQYNETASIYSSGKLLTYNNELLYYRTEPNHAEVVNITLAGLPYPQISLDPAQYNLIGNHVVQNGKLFLIGNDYVLDCSGSLPVTVLDSGMMIQLNPAYISDSSFYLYEISPTTGTFSTMIEVGSVSSDAVRYPVTTDGGFMLITHPMVENNGDLKFIYRTQGAAQSTDIYSFSSVLDLDENDLATFDIYPNPSNDGNFSIDIPQAGEVKIYMLDGQLVQSYQLSSGVNQLELKNARAGIYLVAYNQRMKRLLVH